jgi:hypothetical protein
MVAGMQSAITAGIGLFVGLVAGIASVILASATAERIRIIEIAYWSLVILMPIGVWLGHDASPHGIYKENGERAYASLPSSLATSGAGALVGGLLGALLLFPFVPGFLPVLVAGEDASTFGPAVRSMLLTTPFWVMLITTVGTGLLMGFITHRRMNEDLYD